MKFAIDRLSQPMKCRRRCFAASGLIALFIAVSGLTACAGVESSLPTQKIDNDINVNLIPVTPDLIQKQLPQPPEVEEQEDLRATFKINSSEYRYHLGVGDILTLSVPTLATASDTGGASSSPTIIGQQGNDFEIYDDGSILLPFTGSLKVEGLTVREASTAIVTALSKFLRAPQIVVTMKDYRSQRVLITGQVNKPGYVPVTEVPLTLVAALSEAGGLIDVRGRKDVRSIGTSAALSGAPPIEAPDLAHVALTRNGIRHVINLQNLLSHGKDIPDPILQDGDVVYVPPTARGNVIVMGEVMHPQLDEIAVGRTSLADVIMTSGGINQITAKPSRIYVIRGPITAPDVYQINAQDPQGFYLTQAFPIVPHDIVFISEAPVNRWNRFLQAILPSIQGVVSTAVIVDTVNNVK